VFVSHVPADADDVDFIVLSWVASGVAEEHLVSQAFRTVTAERKHAAIRRLVAANLITRTADGTLARTAPGHAAVAKVNAQLPRATGSRHHARTIEIIYSFSSD
jgi:hypothetical protein